MSILKTRLRAGNENPAHITLTTLLLLLPMQISYFLKRFNKQIQFLFSKGDELIINASREDFANILGMTARITKKFIIRTRIICF